MLLLDDIKTAYVEIVNPLLCREVVETVQRLPIALRENKIVFDNIVRQMFPMSRSRRAMRFKGRTRF